MNFLMNNLAFLFEVGTFGMVAGIVIFLMLAAVAFFLVKKTVKMAIRMAIVGAILLIAIVGGISFWMFASDSKPAARPTNSKNR